MIYLTKKTGDKIRFSYNHHLIKSVHDSSNGTMITTRDAELLIVEETVEEIVTKIKQYEADVLALAHWKKEEGTCS